MKQGKEDFKFVKDSNNDSKRNYIFQNDKITIGTTTFVSIILALLVLAVIFIPKIFN